MCLFNKQLLGGLLCHLNHLIAKLCKRMHYPVRVVLLDLFPHPLFPNQLPMLFFPFYALLC